MVRMRGRLGVNFRLRKDVLGLRVWMLYLFCSVLSIRSVGFPYWGDLPLFDCLIDGLKILHVIT